MPFTDYKALVCFFQYGGNDHANTVFPVDATNYALYQSARGALALPTAGAHTLPTSQTLTNNMQLAMHQNLAGLRPWWIGGDLAWLLNVGALIQPITRAQWDARTVPVPPQLFSHNDQQTFWQTGKVELESPTTGYGGLMADRIRDENTIPSLTSVTPAGTEVFLAGDVTVPYAASVNGAVLIDPVVNARTRFGNAAGAALSALVTATSSPHALKRDYADAHARSVQYGTTVANAFATSAITFANQTSLSRTFQTVARMIEARNVLGAKRQIFLVPHGGYDTHSDSIFHHGNRMTELNTALTQFWSAIVGMNLQDSVTVFSASEFGRTLAQNSSGSDHGWGGHHFILGGSVDGGKFFGVAPPMSITDSSQVGGGRVIPTTSSDQYLYTLGQWFGVLPADLDVILPNVNNFTPKNLGFML